MRFPSNILNLCGQALKYVQLSLAAQEAVSPAAVVPDDDAPEILRLQIQWNTNRAFQAYTKALEEHEPTLLLFTAQQCGFCLTMLQKLNCPEIARYAGFLQFAQTFRGEDEGGDQLGEALKVFRYPATVILQTDEDQLIVVGRIEGVFSAPQIDAVLQEAFKTSAENGGMEMPDLLGVRETRTMRDALRLPQPSAEFCAQ
ncbi:hypothetical protein ACFMBG_21120 [Leisingera sp. D0M16]|uniref:hypothetical protein n=1 Tax=Leisingera coralii TaxID=3351347 RepID=UPI003B7ACF61